MANNALKKIETTVTVVQRFNNYFDFKNNRYSNNQNWNSEDKHFIYYQ